jgi:hypothetical protein
MPFYVDDATVVNNNITRTGYVSGTTRSSSFQTESSLNFEADENAGQYIFGAYQASEVTASSSDNANGYDMPMAHMTLNSEDLRLITLYDAGRPSGESAEVTPTQSHRLRETPDFELFPPNTYNYNAPPPYSPSAPAGLFTREETDALITQRPPRIQLGTVPVKPKRKRARRPSINCSIPFRPLPCGEENCDKVFRGPYQKGNRKRHLKNVHAKSRTYFICRQPGCGRKYQREDAKRKHEWQNHQMKDCEPAERRKQKSYLSGVLG